MALIVLLVASVVAIVYVSYSFLTAPKASISLGGATADCSQVIFQVKNQDSRILQNWAVLATVSPSDSSVTINPEITQIEALAPQGVSVQHYVSVSFSGAPRGVYQLTLTLKIGSQQIGSAVSLNCQN